jgi:hypothetical protein
MGMRINTAIGFGLDISGLNKDHLLNRYEGDKGLWGDLSNTILQDIRLHKEDLFSESIFFGERFQEKASLDEKHMKPFRIGNCVTYESEFLAEDKLLFQTYPFGERWSRYDDDIDYFVSGMLTPLLESTEVIWETTKHGIYPYNGLMRRNLDKPLGVEFYMDSCYMDRDEDYIASLTTAVPLQILFFIKHMLQVEEKDLLDVFFKVKPTFARWWS